MKSVNESRFAFFSSLFFFFFFEPDSLLPVSSTASSSHLLLLFRCCLPESFTLFLLDFLPFAPFPYGLLFAFILFRYFLTRTLPTLHFSPSEPEDSEPLPSKIAAIGASCRWFGWDSNNKLDMAPSIQGGLPTWQMLY